MSNTNFLCIIYLNKSGKSLTFANISDDYRYKCKLSELDAHRSASRYLGTRIYADAPKIRDKLCRQTRVLFAKKKPPERVYVTPPILKSNLHRIVAGAAVRARPSTKDLVPPLHPFRSLAQALVLQYSQGRRGTICHGHRDSRSDDRA